MKELISNFSRNGLNLSFHLVLYFIILTRFTSQRGLHAQAEVSRHFVDVCTRILFHVWSCFFKQRLFQEITYTVILTSEKATQYQRAKLHRIFYISSFPFHFRLYFVTAQPSTLVIVYSYHLLLLLLFFKSLLLIGLELQSLC